jgi:hypothetical protein
MRLTEVRVHDAKESFAGGRTTKALKAVRKPGPCRIVVIPWLGNGDQEEWLMPLVSNDPRRRRTVLEYDLALAARNTRESCLKNVLAKERINGVQLNLL